MNVAEVMTPDVDLADPNMTVRDAALLMRQDDVGALPVGENDRLVGMVTDRDLALWRPLAERGDSAVVARSKVSSSSCRSFSAS